MREPKCKTCGEPETGELGWFDDSENQTVCQRCGSDPTKSRRKPEWVRRSEEKRLTVKDFSYVR